ncbi:MAG: sigma-70 family RNA polymerase sigma factor [bacterium]
MKNFFNKDFPEFFGDSPDDFLKRYIRLIYKIIHNKKDNLKSVGIEPDDLFQDFFIYIQKNNFEKLENYNPNKSSPQYYLVLILKSFIKDTFKKFFKKSSPEIVCIEDIRKDLNISNQSEQNYISIESIRNAFMETYSNISNQKKLIFDLTYEDEKDSKYIANLLGYTRSQIFESNRRVREILLKNLEKRGIIIK